MTPQEQQDKARFFGQYIGAKLLDLISGENPQLAGVTKAIDCTDYTVRCAIGGGRYDRMIKNCKLILRSLSDLTDIEVQHITEAFGRKAFDAIEMKSKKWECRNIRFMPVQSELADYLRSRNFALPFMGYDVVAKGWAILETTNQPQG